MKDKIYNEDCVIGIKRIPDGSIDAILTDPPYLYLKNQKLDKEFDEDTLFKEWMRVLKDDGMIAVFGRGVPCARWLVKLDEIGFKHKEDMVWNKSYCPTPGLAVSRCSENFYILAKGKGKVIKTKVPYLQMKGHDLASMQQDIKRLCEVLRSPESLCKVLKYIEGIKDGGFKRDDWEYNENMFKESITGDRKSLMLGNLCVTEMQKIEVGMNEKTIILEPMEKFGRIHPTQKPVSLLIRILNLISKKGDTILDCFSGSGSTAVACMKSGRGFIGFELDKEYYDKSIERIHSERDLFTF